jgi:ABC-2 type transport system ATP-binding protein
VLEDASFHPGRTGRNHLRVLAAAGGHPQSRVDEVLDAVGLGDAGGRRVKGYSMGMRQRLAIAAALLGDPRVLILDEPTNGLDPPGIAWMRGLLREQAAQGRAVLISSHLLAEVAQSVDDVVVIARGELRGKGTLDEVLGAGEEVVTAVRAQDPARMADALSQRGFWGETQGDTLLVRGATPEQVGIAAHEDGLVLFGLAPHSRSLETAFFALTADQPAASPPPGGLP